MRLTETRNYGFNQIIKQYARFHWYLPLPAHFEHGWSPVVLESDLLTDKPLMLVFSRRRAEDWKKRSQIPVAIVGSPFTHYKNMFEIRQKKDAKGTVAFPSHSTYGLKSRFSLEQYCRELKSLPARFQPITVCLFWLDYIEKKADIYRKYGFKVVTAGYKFSIGLDFAKNFYQILSSHKYATSNDIGSYTFYAVDFGLPFFLTGKIPLVNNVGKDVNVGKITQTDDFKYGAIATRMFETGPATTISAKQKMFVDSEMGINDCLSPRELEALLNRYNQSYCSPLKTALYLLESALLGFVLNGPWGRTVIAVRKTVKK